MWSFEHSVECKVDRNFAWQFWTNVSNWAAVDSSIESATLDGQFQSGTKGSTQLRGGEAIHWRLEGVKEPCGAVVIAHVPGAALRCTWKFEDSGIRATRITQQASIEGERAQDYVSTVAPELEKGIPLGMQKLAATTEEVALGLALGRWLFLF
jgi:hypothetical protein